MKKAVMYPWQGIAHLLALSICLVAVLASSPLARGAGYRLSDGAVVEGEPLSFNFQGAVFKKVDGTFTPRIGWTNFTGEALKQLHEQPKARAFVEPYLAIDKLNTKVASLEAQLEELRRRLGPSAPPVDKTPPGSVPVGSSTEGKLIGAWELDMGIAKVIVNYTRDHKWTRSMTAVASQSESGTWKIDGNKIVSKIEASSIEPESVGKSETSEIVTLDDTILVLRDKDNTGKQSLATLKRLRSK